MPGARIDQALIAGIRKFSNSNAVKDPRSGCVLGWHELIRKFKLTIGEAARNRLRTIDCALDDRNAQATT
jgi:hypothetical protein